MTERSLTAGCGVVPIEDGTADEDVAKQVMRLMIVGEDWVQICYNNNPSVYSRWTVLSRDERGVPLQICSQEFDGTMEIISNDPKYDD